MGAFLLFEEPVSHWSAHDTVVSNGLIAAPQGHKLLKKLLRAINPGAEVFATTGSHMIQVRRRRSMPPPPGAGAGFLTTALQPPGHQIASLPCLWREQWALESNGLRSCHVISLSAGNAREVHERLRLLRDEE